jgi:predicted kinase
MMTIDYVPPGSPTLVIIRGNSGSGKSTVAAEVRRCYGRGCALVEQDYLRRVVLREHGSDSTPTKAPGFIMTTTRAALGAGYHVVLEGILHTRQHGVLLRELIAEHSGRSAVFWMDVPFDETVRRHAGRPDMAHISAETMASWYIADDLLGVDGEQVIPEQSTVEESVTAILHDSGLAQADALTPCPRLCRRCAEKADPASGAALEKGAMS